MNFLSTCRNCNLCKSNIVIHEETACKIKSALSENVTKEYKEELMENKAPANVTSTIMGLPADTVHDLNIINNSKQLFYDDIPHYFNNNILH